MKDYMVLYRDCKIECIDKLEELRIWYEDSGLEKLTLNYYSNIICGKSKEESMSLSLKLVFNCY